MVLSNGNHYRRERDRKRVLLGRVSAVAGGHSRAEGRHVRKRVLQGRAGVVAGERSRWAEGHGTLAEGRSRLAGDDRLAVRSVHEREQRSGHGKPQEVQCCSMRLRCSNHSCTSVLNHQR